MSEPQKDQNKNLPMDQKLCPSCEEPVIDKYPACPLACMSKKCPAYKKRRVVNIHHKPIIWILGGPGCGKGTQCKMIKEKYGFTHISTGDLLRAEVKNGTERAKCLTTIMKRGGLVPNDIVLSLLYEEVKRLEPTSIGFLIDGYPRERHQGAEFEKAIGPAAVIIYFETNPETLMSRLMTRAATAEFLRIDDTEEAFELRIETFMHYNQEVLDVYLNKIHRINAEGSKEQIFSEVQKCIEPILEKAKIAIHASATKKAVRAGLPPPPAPVSTTSSKDSKPEKKDKAENK